MVPYNSGARAVACPSRSTYTEFMVGKGVASLCCIHSHACMLKPSVDMLCPTGGIGWRVYGDYCAYSGWALCALILASLIVGQAAYLGSEYWCVLLPPLEWCSC